MKNNSQQANRGLFCDTSVKLLLEVSNVNMTWQRMLDHRLCRHDFAFKSHDDYDVVFYGK